MTLRLVIHNHSEPEILKSFVTETSGISRADSEARITWLVFAERPSDVRGYNYGIGNGSSWMVQATPSECE